MNDTIQIPRKEYLELKVAFEKLCMLQAGGVDNWQWYGDSLFPDGEDGIDVIEKKLTKEIMGE